jgi:hypothetical protein
MVLKEDFDKFISNEIKVKMGGAYGFLGYSCLIGIAQWCNRSSRNHTKPINWVFEAGTKGRDQLNRAFSATYDNVNLRNRSRLGSWMFQGKDSLPLQAADVLSYEFYKLILNHEIHRENRPVRLSLDALVGKDKYPYLKYFNRDALEKFSKEWSQRSGSSG